MKMPYVDNLILHFNENNTRRGKWICKHKIHCVSKPYKFPSISNEKNGTHILKSIKFQNSVNSAPE